LTASSRDCARWSIERSSSPTTDRLVAALSVASQRGEEILFFNINTPDDDARAIELDGAYRSLIR
jgi:hypothetical protein